MYSYTGTAYISGFEYGIYKTKNQGYGGVWYYYDVFTANKIYTPEGYIDYLNSNIVSNGVRYNYYRKDHLGNIREVWNGVRKNYYNQVKEAASTRQRTQYYPSGLPWASNAGDNPSSQNRKYNDKEFIEMHGLDEYDSEARWYYPAIMRTTTIDPLAEKYYSISPYAWCGNNPVRIMDLNGMDWFYNDQTGDVFYSTILRKGAEEGMTKGWQWMGENGMFSKNNDNIDNILYTDLSLVRRYGGSEEFPFVVDSKGEIQRMVNYTLNLEGRDAKNFMIDMGYEFKPTQQIRFETEITYKQDSGTEVKTGQLTYITEKSGYVPKGAIENKFTPLNDASFKFPSSVNRFRIEYTSNIIVKGLNSLMPFIGYHNMRIPTVYPSLSAYPRNNDLINTFLRRNPIPL